MHKNTFSIHLIEDPIILHGSPDDSVGRILSGYVSLTLSKAMSAKCVSLRLKGKVEFHRIKEIWEKVTIVDRTWILLKPGAENYLLDAKTHRFPFEFALRGNLPDSVDVAHCRVSYRLSSMVERPLFWNTKTSRTLRIQRTCSPLVDQRFITHSLGVWAKSLYYNVSLEKGSFTPGELIPVSFKFLSQNKEYHITEIIVSIREVASYTDLNLKPAVDSEKVYQRTFDSRAYSLDQGLQVTMPMPMNIHCDCSSDIITVSHLIVAKIRLMDAFQRRWYFYIDVPFVVQSHAQHELSSSPPSYEFSDLEMSPPPYQRLEVFCR